MTQLFGKIGHNTAFRTHLKGPTVRTLFVSISLDCNKKKKKKRLGNSFTLLTKVTAQPSDMTYTCPLKAGHAL